MTNRDTLYSTICNNGLVLTDTDDVIEKFGVSEASSFLYQRDQ